MTTVPPPTSVDEYIADFSSDVQVILTQVRASMRRSLPDADERIRYGMAACMLGGRYALHLVGWKDHVGLYPVPALPADLEREVASYRTTKDTVRFLCCDSISANLIERIAAAAAAGRSDTGRSWGLHSVGRSVTMLAHA